MQPTEHEDPHSCYAAFALARKKGDYAGALACMTTDTRNSFVGKIAYEVEREVLFSTPNKDTASKLLKQHSLHDADIIGQLQIASSTGKRPVDVFCRVGSTLSDQGDFLKSASKILERTIIGAEKDWRLVEVEISGDQATGKTQVDGEDEVVPIYFRKEVGSWLLTWETPPISEQK